MLHLFWKSIYFGAVLFKACWDNSPVFGAVKHFIGHLALSIFKQNSFIGFIEEVLLKI